MARLLNFVAAVTALTAAISIPATSATHPKAEAGVRGRRTTEYNNQPEYCNSIGCPNGFIPIDNASETPCPDDDCSVANCCQTKCAFFACPNGFTPANQEERCYDDVCTQEQCCEALCSGFACPNGFTPVPYANTIACDYQDCTKEQCCEALCSGFACPNGFIPVTDAHNIACDHQECTKEQCCTTGNNNYRG